MNIVDARKIVALQAKGYKVVVKDPLGKDFTNRYEVYQSGGFHQLKRVVVNDKGEPFAVQG